MLTNTAVAPDVAHFLRIDAASNLTELQRLYWIGHQLRPSSAHFNNAFLFTFATPIDPDNFKQAFASAVQQYDALRTIVEEVQSVPQQRVLPEPPAILTFVDLSEKPDPATALVQWQQQQVQQPFLLDKCLYDTALLKLDDTHFAWFLNLHHLITDASSFFLIANVVIEQYEALRGGADPSLAEKPSFARYLATQQRFRTGGRAEKSEQFWQEKREHQPDPLHFYGRSPHKTSDQVQRWTHNLGASQTAQLLALAEHAELGAATLELRQFCLTAALFFGLLHQITGNSRLGFVTTIHTRSTQLTRETVGPLMELCPVMVTIASNETFLSLMQKVAAEMKQLLRHYRSGASRAASDLSTLR